MFLMKSIATPCCCVRIQPNTWCPMVLLLDSVGPAWLGGMEGGLPSRAQWTLAETVHIAQEELEDTYNMVS